MSISEISHIENPRLAKISIIVLIVTILGFFVSEILQFMKIADIHTSYVALGGAAILYAMTSDRRNILKEVNYTVLIFFVTMFVVTSALWESGAVSLFMKHLPVPNPANILQSNALISGYSVVFSQILSNVPFVSLYNHVMTDNGFTGLHVTQWLMLAAASTVAGNLTILGAASTVIIIQSAESKDIKAFTFLEFLKIGSIVTIANLSVYYLFLVIF